MPNTTYDILIVGAGLAGLHCALRTIENNPKLHIAIAEAYNYVGGRVISYTPPTYPYISWENGAGRIHTSHSIILNYIQRYGLTTFPIPSGQEWIEVDKVRTPDVWKEISEFIDTSLSTMNPSILATHTLKEILESIRGKEGADKLLLQFPYRAEVETLRADLALKTFRNEMHSPEGFVVVLEGLSALIKAMKQELESKGVRFLMNHQLTKVSKTNPDKYLCTFKNAEIKADRVILALHRDALQKISPFHNYPPLKYLAMKPLLRTYGIFPFPAWFATMGKVVTDSPLRFVIPVNPLVGSIMTSYTESQDAEHWISIYEKKGEKALEKETMNKLRELFPETTIPDPLFFKAHPWQQGCTYWLPGLYDPKEVSEKLMNPFSKNWQGLFVCGESYSMRQTWMEGALEHAESMLKKFFF